MVDRITKFLKKLNRKEPELVHEYINSLMLREFSGYHIRKLTGKDNYFRLRRGRVRIIYFDDGVNEIRILKISFRDESTYKGL